MAGDIRFRSKKDGRVKFTASQTGIIDIIGKDGKKQPIQYNDTRISETVKIKKQDYKDSK